MLDVSPSDWLPHQGDMVMIHQVEALGDKECTCLSYVDRLVYFRDPHGRVPTWVGIEIMAQTAAVQNGIKRGKEGKAPQLGFLVSTRKYNCYVPYFLSHQVLRIHALQTFGNNTGMNVITCLIHSLKTGDLLADASLNVFVPKKSDFPETIL